MSPQNRAVQPVVMAIVAALITPAAGLATPMKIACVGDSITEGSGLSFPNRDSYPAKLQQLLGTNYLVRNFGVSGRTLLKKGDFPFWAEPAFTSSHTFNPDVVIINLGTNDAKPQNWRYGTNYTTDYDALIATYTALVTHPRMVLCTPCPAFKTGAFDINPGVVNTNIAPQVRRIADQHGYSLADLNLRIKDHSEWFADNIHPDAKGTTVLAAVLYPILTGTGIAPGPLLAANLVFTGTKVELAWSADSAAYVLQGSTLLPATSNKWLIVEQVAYNDGQTVRVTNSITSPRFFRLWRP